MREKIIIRYGRKQQITYKIKDKIDHRKEYDIKILNNKGRK